MNISSLVMSHRPPNQLPRLQDGSVSASIEERSELAFALRSAGPTVSPMRTTGTLEALLAQSALDRSTMPPRQRK